MALTVQTALVPIDDGVSSLNTFLSTTTINSIEIVLIVGGEFLVLYT